MGIWKEVVVRYFKVIPGNSPGATDKLAKTASFDFYPLSWFESDTFRKGVSHVFIETLCVLRCECRLSQHKCIKYRRMNHHDDVNWPKNENVRVPSTWAKSYFGWALCCVSLGIFIDRLRPDLAATRRRELAMEGFFSQTLNYGIGSQSEGHSPLKTLCFYVFWLKKTGDVPINLLSGAFV